MINVEPDKKVKKNSQFITIIMNTIVSIVWLCWFALTKNGRYPDVMLGEGMLDILIATFGQILSLATFFTIILVWMSIVNSTQTLTKITSETDKRNNQIIISFIILLILILFPMGIIGQLYIPIIKTIYIFSFALIILCLTISGIIYARKLTNILNKTILDVKKRNAIINIKFVISIVCCLSILILIAQGSKMVILRGPVQNLWVYTFISQLCMIILTFLIAYSVSQRARSSIDDKYGLLTILSFKRRDTTVSTQFESRKSTTSSITIKPQIIPV